LSKGIVTISAVRKYGKDVIGDILLPAPKYSFEGVGMVGCRARCTCGCESWVLRKFEAQRIETFEIK